MLAVVQLPLLVSRFRGWRWGIIRSFYIPGLPLELLCFAVSIWQDGFKPLIPCSLCTRAMLSASRNRNQASNNCCCLGVNFTTLLVGYLSLVLGHSPSRESSDAWAIHSSRCPTSLRRVYASDHVLSTLVAKGSNPISNVTRVNKCGICMLSKSGKSAMTSEYVRARPLQTLNS